MGQESERRTDHAGNGQLSPEHHPVSLVFADADLERDYRRAMYEQTAPTMRFGIVLAILLYAWFAVIDRWMLDDPGGPLAVRAVVVLLSVLLLLLSPHGRFFKVRETTVTLFMLLLTSGIALIIAYEPAVMNQYYAGYALIIVGVFTIFGLRFPNALIVSLTIVALYLASEYFLRGNGTALVANNTTFLVGTLVIAAIGSYTAERQRRLAYFRLRVIEQERAMSEHVALHDPLTGLPNRRLFFKRLEQAVARAVRLDTLCAVLFVDLDGFKAVNDERGHAFGDRVLKNVASRLAEGLRATETVARFGGDEFVVLLEDIGDAANLNVPLERVRRSFAEPCEVDGVRLTINCSIGAAVYPRDGGTPRELLEAADASMYRIKRARGL